MLGWIVVGVFLSLALKYFWEDIAQWLNNTAANAVERKFGIDARKTMQKAVCRVTRVMNKIDNVARVYFRMDEYYLKRIDLHATQPEYETDKEVLKELDEKKELINEFTYNG